MLVQRQSHITQTFDAVDDLCVFLLITHYFWSFKWKIQHFVIIVHLQSLTLQMQVVSDWCDEWCI